MRILNYDEKSVVLHVSAYINNPLGISLKLIDTETNKLVETITANLGSDVGSGVLSLYTNFVDVTYNEGKILRFLEDNNIAEPYRRMGAVVIRHSDSIDYPLYYFHPDELKKCDPEGCVSYENSYNIGFAKQRQKLLSEANKIIDRTLFEPETQLELRAEEDGPELY